MSAPSIPSLGHIETTASSVSWLSRIFSFPAMLSAGLMFLVFWTCAERFDDPDLWWHLKLGEIMWNSHQIPSTDLLSFTARGSGWIAHEWLPQVILYGVYRLGSLSALQVGFSLLAASIVILTYLLCSLWSGNWKVSLLGGMGSLFFLTVSLAIRPLMFGHLFLLLELLLLYAALVKGRQAWLVALPILFVVWANSHGSFLFGLIVLCGSIASYCLKLEGFHIRPARGLLPFVAIVILCLLAPLANPIGPSLATYPIDVLLFQPDNTGSVQEWAALDLFEPRGMGLAGLLLFVVAMAITLRRKIEIGEWVALGLTAAMALQHVRMLPIFGFFALPIVCRLLANYWDNWNPRRDFPVINALLIGVAVMLCITVLPTQAAIEQQIRTKEPVAAIAKMKEAGWPGPVLNEYTWGGYMLWSHPDEPVFIDGRTDIYAWNGVLREYGRWSLLQADPRELLDRYQIRTCIIRIDAPMAHVLPYLPGWKQVYSDKLAVVFTRDSAPTP